MGQSDKPKFRPETSKPDFLLLLVATFTAMSVGLLPAQATDRIVNCVDFGVSGQPGYVAGSGNFAISQQSGLTTVSRTQNECKGKAVIPADVEYIDQVAFQIYGDLKAVEFAAGSQLREIGQGAFGSTGISTITIPNSVITISANVFAGSNISEINFSNNSQLATIGDGAFGYSQLAQITIPATVQVIGGQAFQNATQLTLVNFEQNSTLRRIEQEVFRATPSLSSVLIPRSTTFVGANAFLESAADTIGETGAVFPATGGAPIFETSGNFAAPQSPSLEGFAFASWSFTVGGNPINFPISAAASANSTSALQPLWNDLYPSVPCTTGSIGIDLIGQDVVVSNNSSCTGEVEIPSEVTRIGGYAFNQAQITTVSFEAGSQLKKIGDAAFNLTSLTQIRLPASLEELGVQSLTSPNLSHVSFEPGSRLRKIGNDAFVNTSLVSISLSNTVRFIGQNAFYNLTNLRLSIQSGSALDFVGENAFLNAGDSVRNQVSPLSVSQLIGFVGPGAFDNSPYGASISNRVTLDLAGGSDAYWENDNYTLTAGVSGPVITNPATPTRSGYVFGGWATSQNGPAITFPYTPSTFSGLTLYALWDGGSAPAPSQPQAPSQPPVTQPVEVPPVAVTPTASATSSPSASGSPTVPITTSPKPSSSAETPSAPALSSIGIKPVTAAEAAKAPVLAASSPVSLDLNKAPMISANVGAPVVALVGGLPASAPLQVSVLFAATTKASYTFFEFVSGSYFANTAPKVTYISLGKATTTKTGRVKLPAFKATKTGVYTVKMTTKTGRNFFLKVKVGPKK